MYTYKWPVSIYIYVTLANCDFRPTMKVKVSVLCLGALLWEIWKWLRLRVPQGYCDNSQHGSLTFDASSTSRGIFYFLEDPVMRFQFAKWLADDKVTVPIQGWNGFVIFPSFLWPLRDLIPVACDSCSWLSCSEQESFHSSCWALPDTQMGHSQRGDSKITCLDIHTAQSFCGPMKVCILGGLIPSLVHLSALSLAELTPPS